MMSDTPAEAEQMAEPNMAPETEKSAEETAKQSAEQTAEQSAEPSVEPSVVSAKSVQAVMLDDHYFIDPSAPREELDTPTAKAYLAEDRRHPEQKLFALICNPDIPIRMEAIEAIKGASFRGMLSLVASGPVTWTPLSRKCVALIYERPLGGPALNKDTKNLSRIKEYDFPTIVISPLVKAISELDSRGIAHRAIHPNNLYFIDKERQQLVVGDCIAAPPGYNQPILYETISSGMADPDGRSVGRANEDLYALGCTIIFLLVDSHPCDRMTDDQILVAKIEKSSFSALCTNTRVPVPFLEALRGMLNDDSALRWGVREADGWLNGLKPQNRQRKTTIRGDLPYEFMKFEHISPRTIAYSFSQNVPEALEAIKNGELTTWVRRLLHNPRLSEAIALAAEMIRPTNSDIASSGEFAVAKICILLDPSAPIRYKGLSFMPESIGTKLVMELNEKANILTIRQLILNGLPDVWISAQTGPPNSAKLKHLISLYSQIRSYFNITDFGFGIERCVYELNDGLRCLSPLLELDYVIDLDKILPALDDAANRVDGKHHPVDRHIAAFVIKQHNQNIEPHLKAVSSSKESTKLIGVLSLLALLQWRFKPGPLYGLASWIGGMLGPVIDTYHSRATRREIEREIPRLVRKGNLPDLFDLIDNIEKRQIDNDEFTAAKIEFNEAQHEISQIESNSASKRREYENKGQQIAAMTSLILSMIIIMVLLVMESV